MNLRKQVDHRPVHLPVFVRPHRISFCIKHRGQRLHLLLTAVLHQKLPQRLCPLRRGAPVPCLLCKERRQTLAHLLPHRLERRVERQHPALSSADAARKTIVLEQIRLLRCQIHQTAAQIPEDRLIAEIPDPHLQRCADRLRQRIVDHGVREIKVNRNAVERAGFPQQIRVRREIARHDGKISPAVPLLLCERFHADHHLAHLLPL